MSDKGVWGELCERGEIREASEEERKGMTTTYYKSCDASLVSLSGTITPVWVLCSFCPHFASYSFWGSENNEVFVGLGPDPLSDPWYAVPEGDANGCKEGTHHTTVGSIFLIKECAALSIARSMGCVERAATIKEDDGRQTDALTLILPGTNPRAPFRFQGHCLLKVGFKGWELLKCGSPMSGQTAPRIGVDLGPYEAWVYF